MSFYCLSATLLEGTDVSLDLWAGRLTLAVAVTCRSGFASQLAGLQGLHERYASRGLAVLGFPTAQFEDDLTDPVQIRTYLTENYQVGFPVFAPGDIAGPTAQPAWRWLDAHNPGPAPRWSYTKYLVDPDGAVIGRLSTSTRPTEMLPVIEAHLPGRLKRPLHA